MTDNTKMADEHFKEGKEKQADSFSSSSSSTTTASTVAEPKVAGAWDQVLNAEHIHIRKFFEQIEGGGIDSTNVSKRASVLNDLRQALTKHIMQKEFVIYPAMHNVGLSEECGRLNKEVMAFKQYMFDLLVMDKGSADWVGKFSKFRGEWDQHVQREETIYYPALRGKLTDHANKQLTECMYKESTKMATITDWVSGAAHMVTDNAGFAAHALREKIPQVATVIKEKVAGAAGRVTEVFSSKKDDKAKESEPAKQEPAQSS